MSNPKAAAKEKPQENYVPPTIIITLNQDGTVNVSAPMREKLLCHGMLGMAAAVVNRFEVPGIVRPPFKPVPPLNS